MKWVRARQVTVVLALLMNAIGSPMAWAQWVEAGPSTPAVSSAEIESAPCHDQEHTADGEPAPASTPCCDGGSCTCAAPALFVYLAPSPSRTPRLVFLAPPDTATLPAHPLDDTLRPPIR